ncbi:hypothetical protein O5190_27595, partial [Escherichia coli]|nr:hypothetical protein [Escherichia coli]
MARNKQALRRTAQATADGYENFIARVGTRWRKIFITGLNVK